MCADNLLKSLDELNNDDSCKFHSHDAGEPTLDEVIDTYRCGEQLPKLGHALRHSDGSIRRFSFEQN